MDRMKAYSTLRFVLRDRVNNTDVGPKHVPMKLLGEFQQSVSDFLRGSTRDVDLADVIVSIEDGSLQFVTAGLENATTLWADLETLASPTTLHQIDPKRAEVIEAWQAASRQYPGRTYLVSDVGATANIVVDCSSNFSKASEPWVAVEKYVHGRILSWGGKSKASVRIELDDGSSLIVEATQSMLEQEKENRLYKNALLHITAEENLTTGALRNPRLLAFESHHPAYDEAEFQAMVDKGTAAWSDVPGATEWLENLRGGNA